MRSRWVSWALLGSLLAQTDCYSWVRVNPVDASNPTGSGTTRPIGPSVVDIRQPDGKLVELSEEYDVRLTLKNGEVHKFVHPIGVEANGVRLVFHGGHQTFEVDPDDIAMFEASKLNPGTTTLVVVLVTLAAAAFIAFVAVLAKVGAKHASGAMSCGSALSLPLLGASRPSSAPAGRHRPSRYGTTVVFRSTVPYGSQVDTVQYTSAVPPARAVVHGSMMFGP